MKFAVRFLTSVCAMALLCLACNVFLLPREILALAMAVVGFVAAIFIVITVEWWIRDEKEYEERLKKQERRRRISNHYF